ncbi:UDP-N-acetylmuramate dehydrogenase [Holophaga foetida]|uniref:UDP-N-acetylmuramate dehydrogenase n=1 Tax=Holophaga foetida TaxID=35839 RepID=UPI0002474CF5|nr:UDP-N-acetylmuramate dehydrogenase [Holophaga foetida]
MLIPNASLEALNTLHLPGKARRFAEISSADQLQALIRGGELSAGPVVVLGGGSNVVISGDLEATVLHIRIPGRELVGEDAEAFYVRAGAGEDWPDFVTWTLEQGWGGLENLAFIPGTVGAAPVQNIGAYGLEAKDRFHSLEALNLHSGCTLSLDRGACRFGYRESLFKTEEGRGLVVTSVTFRLPKGWKPEAAYLDLARELSSSGFEHPTPLQVAQAVTAVRRRKLPDPLEIASAGSFFKNPVLDPKSFASLKVEHPQLPSYPQADGRFKVAAGWLIEQCGWKGRSLGPVGMFAHQALVLVNHGGATGADVLRLAETVRADVRTRFGIELEMEPVVL